LKSFQPERHFLGEFLRASPRQPKEQHFRMRCRVSVKLSWPGKWQPGLQDFKSIEVLDLKFYGRRNIVMSDKSVLMSDKLLVMKD